MSEPISEADLEKIEAAALQARRTGYDHVHVELVNLACESVPRLIEEVRRLNLRVEAAQKILSGGYEQGMNGRVINRNQVEAWLKGADKPEGEVVCPGCGTKYILVPGGRMNCYLCRTELKRD